MVFGHRAPDSLARYTIDSVAALLVGKDVLMLFDVSCRGNMIIVIADTERTCHLRPVSERQPRQEQITGMIDGKASRKWPDSLEAGARASTVAEQLSPSFGMSAAANGRCSHPRLRER